MTLAEYIFDVALSFAGAQRDYVRDVADRLAANGVSFFFDEREQVRLWGRDMYDALDDIYRLGAIYVIMFTSDAYADKMWPKHERASAQARAIGERDPYILPVRFDDTPIPGLRDTINYQDARLQSPAEIADLVTAKLHADDRWKGQRAMAIQPDRDIGWEYLALVDHLETAMMSYQRSRFEFDSGFVRPSRRHLDTSEVRRYIRDAMTEASQIVSNVERLLGPESLELALGAPGEPGDEDRIHFLANAIASVYGMLLDWAAQLRSVGVPNEFEEMMWFVSRMAEQPLDQIRGFVDEAISGIRAAVDRVRTADPNDDHDSIELTFALVVTVDETLMERILEMLRDLPTG